MTSGGRVSVVDVGPRDGLQNEPEVLEPAVRAELVARLVAAGVEALEVASFVDPRRVPQMAGAEEVVAALERVDGVVYAGLALNERGYERLLATGLDEVRFAFGATESFNERNQNASVAESLAAATRIVTRAREDEIRSAVTISVAFGCPFEGEVEETRVLELAAEVAEAGPDALLLADTIGVASPGHVRRLVSGVAELGVPVGGHFHNTRNTGYANALVALEAGASVLDASVGGLGGCPFAPKATGNIATEDLVYLLHREGIETGIDLEALIEVSRWFEDVLGRRLEGQLYRAGSFPGSCKLAPGSTTPSHLAELDLARAPAQHDLVAVLEERPLASVSEADRVGTVLRELDQRSLAAVLRAGDRPRHEQVAGPERRAVGCRVCQLLRHRPVQAASVRSRDDGVADVDLELGVERPLARHAQVGQQLGILLRPGDEAALEQRERRDPGGDRRGERLSQERPQRLVLPGLDVPCAPVVDEGDAEHVLAERRPVDRRTERAPDPDDEAELELEVEPAARAEARARARRAPSTARRASRQACR